MVCWDWVFHIQVGTVFYIVSVCLKDLRNSVVEGNITLCSIEVLAFELAEVVEIVIETSQPLFSPCLDDGAMIS